MSYTLKHTAEELDYKLDLINKNKNLLPYPYSTAFPTWLEDVGDGSLLTIAAGISIRALLNTCILPAGKYVISIDIADLADQPVDNSGFSLEIISAGNTIASTNGNNNATFELSTEAAVEVYLNAATNTAVDLLVKPQIEEGEEKTAWAPYMRDIGSYVDERFNSVNAKLRRILDLVNRLAEAAEEA
jgi:hypothetical protein